MKKFILIFIFISSVIFAKDIYVGDKVVLFINGLTKQEIVSGLKNSDLELESIKDSDSGYLVTLRSFKPGKHALTLGDKKVYLNVKSTLGENDKTIYPHLSDKSDLKLYTPHFPYIFTFGTILSILSLGYLIKNFKFNQNSKNYSPEEIFKKRIKNVTDETWDFEISLALREYIDTKYKTHFLNGYYFPIGSVDKTDITFLENLDNYKFSWNNKELKSEYLKKADEIFEKIRRDTTDV